MRPPRSEEAGLLDYWRILWRRRLLVIAVTVLTVAAALAFDALRTPVYEGTANLLFLSQSYTGDGSLNALTPTDIATDIELVGGSQVQVLAARHLGLHPSQLPPVTVSEVGATEVATVSVRDTDPAFAARAANAYATAYDQLTKQAYEQQSLYAQGVVQGQINDLQNQADAILTQIDNTPSTDSSSIDRLNAQLGTLQLRQQTLQGQLDTLQVESTQSPVGGRVVAYAPVPTTPVSPRKTTDAVLAGVVGLVLGIALALLLEFLDDRVRTKEQLEEVVAPLPSLGIIPTIPDWRDRTVPLLVALDRPKSPPAEAYRGLRTAIQFIGLDRPIGTVQITSPAANDGKTTTSANLAVSVAQAGQRVILVGCDLRRPRLHSFFGVANDIGFTSVLIGSVPLGAALVPIPGVDRLQVLPSGPVPPNPSELLGSPRARELLEELRGQCDLLIIDSPPVLPVTDAAVLATEVDAVVLVALAGSTTQRDVRRSLETLARVDAPMVGAVLNGASEHDSYVYYRYGYTYGYDHGEPEAGGGAPVDAGAATGRDPGDPLAASPEAAGTVPAATAGNGRARRSTGRHASN